MSSHSILGVPIKYLSLFVLTLQNSAVTIVMHQSKLTHSNHTKSYFSPSAVLLAELFKGSISLAVAVRGIDRKVGEIERGRERREQEKEVTGDWKAGQKMGASKSKASLSFRGSNHNYSSTPPSTIPTPISTYSSQSLLERDWKPRLQLLFSSIFSADSWKLSIPALLYVLQNNLSFIAASNLDPTTFQVAYQLKILSTALFSVLLLKRKLDQTKWAALVVLAVGVAIVQIQAREARAGGNNPSLTKQTIEGDDHQHPMNPLKGFLAVLTACLTSGLAGVYFEKTLKTSKADLWIRNVQLSIFSLVPAIIPVFWHCFQNFFETGWNGVISPLENFNRWTYATVGLQVLGGLVTALVIKYADNILKGFAVSFSIVLSFVASVVLFGYQVTVPFVVGAGLTVGSSLIYNRPAAGRMEGQGMKKRESREYDYQEPTPDHQGERRQSSDEPYEGYQKSHWKEKRRSGDDSKGSHGVIQMGMMGDHQGPQMRNGNGGVMALR